MDASTEAPETGPQVLITWADWHNCEQAAAEHLLPCMDEAERGAVLSQWHFLRKSPHWRLRYTGGERARRHLDGALERMRQRGAVTDWTHTLYEPETTAFGGAAAMDAAHRLFSIDSRNVLAYLTRRSRNTGASELGRRELAVLTAGVLLRAAGLDWYEQGDVWARVAALRTGSADPSVQLRHQVSRLMTVAPSALTTASGPLAHSAAWIDAFTQAGSRLAVLAAQGHLRRGLRAVCAHHIIFAWNRLGLFAQDQHTLSAAAREAVMSDHQHTAAPATEAVELRRQLVDRLKQAGHIRSSTVEAALQTVPRHLFVPDSPLDEAYTDTQVHTKISGTGTSLSCASQPSIVAMMLHQLQPQPGQRILELGAGTGFNAALLAHLVGDTGHVTTVDVDDDIVEGARAHLAAADVSNVDVVLGDGALGHAKGAPYDGVIATVGAHRIPQAWLDQAAPEGRIVAPVRIAGDVSRSIIFERSGGHWASVDSALCTFMPLRASIGEDPRRTVDLTGDGAVTLNLNQDQAADADALVGVLDQQRHEVWTDVVFGKGEPLDPMWLWLALNLDNALSRMPVRRSAVDSGLVTPMLPWGSMSSATDDGTGLAYLTLRPVPGASPRHQLGVIGHGDTAKALAERMAEEAAAWQEHRNEDVTFALHPDAATAPQSAAGRFVLHRGDARLVVSWTGTP